MDYVSEKLNDLENLARNPNLNGGVWNCFSLFVSISDGLLQRKSLFEGRNNGRFSNDEIIKSLESIRGNFENVFGFVLENPPRFGEKFEARKNSRTKSHLFRNRISQYMKSYANRFI